MNKLEKIFIFIEESIIIYVAGLGLFISIGYVTANVIGRYLFKHPILGMHELVGLILVPITFLSFAYGWRNRGTFIAAEFLLLRMKGRPRWVMELIIQLSALFLFALILGYGGLIDSVWAYKVGQTRGPYGFFIPTWPFISSISLGCLLMIGRVILQIRKLIKGELIKE
ncbi:TRAP transporter small permease [Thermodesulfobacteriota bacterium]